MKKLTWFEVRKEKKGKMKEYINKPKFKKGKIILRRRKSEKKNDEVKRCT